MVKTETSALGLFAFLAITGTIVAFTLTGAKASRFIEDLKKQVVAIRLKKGSNLLTTKLEFDLALTNDSASSLLFQSFNGNLIYKTNSLSTFLIQQDQTIIAKDTTILRIPVSINNLQALDTVLELILKKKAEVPFRIVGTIRIENFNFPIDQEIILKPQKG